MEAIGFPQIPEISALRFAKLRSATDLIRVICGICAKQKEIYPTIVCPYGYLYRVLSTALPNA